MHYRSIRAGMVYLVSLVVPGAMWMFRSLHWISCILSLSTHSPEFLNLFSAPPPFLILKFLFSPQALLLIQNILFFIVVPCVALHIYMLDTAFILSYTRQATPTTNTVMWELRRSITAFVTKAMSKQRFRIVFVLVGRGWRGREIK